MRNKLRELGFSEKEADVYVALVQVGTAVASDIAKKARIKRSTTYVILDSLAEKGLVSMVEQRGVRRYTPAPPEQLGQYMESMAKKYAGFATAAKKLVPELKASRTESMPEPRVHFFQGSEGIKSVYEDTLSSLEGIRVHAAFVHDALERGYDAGKKPTIKMRLLTADAARAGKKEAASHKEALRAAINVARDEADASSEINVYDDRVVFIAGAEDFAVVIESKELADALKQTFEKPVSYPRVAPGTLSPAFG